MTNTEFMNLKAALEAKRLELAAQIPGGIRELSIEEGQLGSDRLGSAHE